MTNQVFGYQLLLDLYGCKQGVCDDLALCYQFLDEINHGSETGCDVETIISKNAQAASLIQQIGRENFEKHFLYNSQSLKPEQAAPLCDITVEQAEQITNFLNEVSLKSECFTPPNVTRQELRISWYKVAQIEKFENKYGHYIAKVRRFLEPVNNNDFEDVYRILNVPKNKAIARMTSYFYSRKNEILAYYEDFFSNSKSCFSFYIER